MDAAQLEELVARIEQWEPGYADTLVGATPAELDDLEQGLGVALVPEHRVFLARMGTDHGGINAYGDDTLDLRMGALSKFVADAHGFDARAFMIAGVPAQFDVPLLMFDARAGTEPAPLVRLGFGDGQNPAISAEHSSLLAMLTVFAFMQKGMASFAWELHLESPGTRRPHFPDCPPGRWLPRFAWICAQQGLEVVPGAGPWAACAQSPDLALMMYECPGYSPDVRVAAREREPLLRVVEILCDNLDLRVRPSSVRAPA